ncbi:penicillin acylase family protein [Alkalicoccus urumqiensis]|nr:penicillin acylase family protein [Alkalicoccus urumqiensis]
MYGTVMTSMRRKRWYERRWWKVVSWTAVVLVWIAAVLLAAVWFYVRSGLPQTDGVIEAPVGSEVRVDRDERGVAQISGESAEDVFFAQGYVMAQDRMFQMDMTRRQAGGRLAEVIGPQAVESDEYFRTYGMHRGTEALTAEFNEETEAMVTAFADGVTAYIEEASSAGELPLEFQVLGYEPEAWTPEDTAIAVKYMGYTLNGNFSEELRNYELLRRFGEEASFYFPDYEEAGEYPAILDGVETAGTDLPALAAGPELGMAPEWTPDPWNGSNNWAVSGEHTDTGLPMLANDPHLGLAIPAVWYQTQLEIEGDFSSMGVTVPGIPGVVLGHNGSVSWGVTSLSADYEDVYLERQDPERPSFYLYDGEYEAAEVIEEEIFVDGEEEPRIHRVEVTRNGPVMNHVEEEGPVSAYSLRWTGMEPGEELNGILRVNRAETVDEFSEGLEGFVTPGLSWMFADTEGGIGFRGQALLPVRPSSTGQLPVPGWDPAYQWDGFIPGEELPQELNPESGYLMTANHQPVPADAYPYEIGRNFLPFRAVRLEELLQERIGAEDPVVLEDMKQMQQDITNTQARELVPLLTEAAASWTEADGGTDMEGEALGSWSATEEEALALLSDWDFREETDSAAALVYQLWYEGLPETLFERHLDITLPDHLTRQRVLTEGAASGTVFSGLEGVEERSIERVIRETFHDAVTRAVELQGDEASGWAWGDYHQLEINHPLGGVFPFNYVLNLGGDALPGSGMTPGAVSYNIETGGADHSAGWRFVSDLQDPEDVLLPGQSGQWLSPHYDDQLDTWVEGAYGTMRFTEPEESLEFRPEQEGDTADE